MFYLGYFLGVVTTGVLFVLGFLSVRFFLQNQSQVEGGASSQAPLFQVRRAKKTPKFVSEEEQWAREQKNKTPRDPGLG